MPTVQRAKRPARLTTCLGLAAAAAACLTATAQPVDPTPNNESDVTHQDIYQVFDWGAVGGVNAYSLGSYTCNLGTQALAWAFNGTPALAQNAYRLHDGRLMQIGQGWAKHACCVANGSGCGSCQSTGEAGLRPGCRDTYTASYNGGQTRLGPRSGINPYVGSFATIPSVPSGSNAIYRRLQVKQADMNATTYAGAQYFVEGVYACAQEKPSAQRNNATYRRVNFANGGATPSYAMSLVTGFTSREGVPAIYAWRDHGGTTPVDTSVLIVTRDIPNDGRFHVAGKVTDLSGTGAGPWRYDYAAFNLNSYRAAGGFVVPIPAHATVTDIGFNDVDYHSGEIYDNTDWVGAKSGSTVAWRSTSTFASNPAGNALRWGIMYNFWFTSTTPPSATTGEVTLEMFQPAPPDADSFQVAGLPIPNQTPACPADVNNDGTVSVQDIFDFLAGYFAGEAIGDFNDDGSFSVQDIFDFLGQYFVPCP